MKKAETKNLRQEIRILLQTPAPADRTPEAFAAAFRQCVAQWEKELAAEAAAMEENNEK